MLTEQQDFKIITLTNSQGMVAQFMDYGATWLSCKVPVNGDLREVLLGCQPADYTKQQAYMGATIGRYANRIANGQFTLNGKRVQLTQNQGENQLHGGGVFDKVRWKIEKFSQNEVVFSYFSSHGEQGFPGNVQVKAIYRVTEDNAVEAEFEAVSDQDTPLNLTNHAYFNLQDAEQGSDVREHQLQLNADFYLPVDNTGIPNAPLKNVENASFDFCHAKRIKQDFLQDEQVATKGYDHSFLLNARMNAQQDPVAILTSPQGDLTLSIFTTQPAVQVYTGNYLAGNPTRNGAQYSDYSGVALETQALPDTPNHPEWQHFGGVSKAGETYWQWTKFSFSI